MANTGHNALSRYFSAKKLAERVKRIGRRDKITVVFKSCWLRGYYGVEVDLLRETVHDRIVDEILALLPGEFNSETLRHIRENPQIDILDVT